MPHRSLAFPVAWPVAVFLLAACGGSQHASPGTPGPAAAVAPLQPDEPLLVLRAVADGAPLFADEREQLRQRAVQFLAAQSGSPQAATPPLRLVPLEDIDAVERTAAHGRRQDAGPRCAAPLATQDLLAEGWPDVAQAEVRAVCTQERCELHLDIRRPRQGAAALLASWRADVAAADRVQGWLQAFSALAAQPVLAGSEQALSVVVEEDDAPRLELGSVRAFGTWSTPPTAESLAPLRQALQACHAPGGSGATADRLVAAVDATGKVERCTVTADQHPPRPDARACLCKVVTAMPFPAGDAGRRLTLSVRDRADDVRGLAGRPVAVRFDDVVSSDGTPVASQLAVSHPALARCAAASPRETVRLGVHLEAAPGGHVTSASLRDLPGSPLPSPPPLLGCVESVLRTVALPCAKQLAPLTVDAVLVLDVRR